MSGSQAAEPVLRVLVVDDENLARARLKTLLEDCRHPPAVMQAQAANAVQAMECLQHQPFDVVLLDIHMPGADGLSLAQAIKALPQPPALIFVTAHAEHAVQAFELDATDYLTKPVRLERLEAALQKAVRFNQARGASPPAQNAPDVLIIQDRNRTERVPLSEVVYFKAELKYVTARTREREYVLEESLAHLEEEYAQRFMRIHRNCIVAKDAIAGCAREREASDAEADPHWALLLHGVAERLQVSRRQWPLVKELIGA